MTKLTGEFLKDIVWIQINPREVIEYIEELLGDIEGRDHEIDSLHTSLAEALAKTDKYDTNPVPKYIDSTGTISISPPNTTTSGT